MLRRGPLRVHGASGQPRRTAAPRLVAVRAPSSWQPSRALSISARPAPVHAAVAPSRPPARSYHASAPARATGQRQLQTSGLVQYKLTDVGEGIAECELLRWYVAEGDRVKAFQKLCEVQSDEATLDITSRYDGVIKKLHYKRGDMAKVGSPLADIDLGGGDGKAPAASPSAPSSSSSAPSPSSPPSAAPPKPASPPSPPSPALDDGKVLTTPAVRRISREAGLSSKDLAAVPATGKDGRLTKEDIITYLSAKQGGAAPAASAPAAAALSSATRGITIIGKVDPAIAASLAAGHDHPVPIRGLTRTMVKTMTASALIPQLGYTEEFNMGALSELRNELRPNAEAAGVKLTYLPFILKAVSLALRAHPILNGSMTAAGDEIVYKARHNVGIAMDTPAGLLVPNVKDVQARTVLQIAAELSRLQREGAGGKLTAADLAGGTISISNIGSIGGVHASPVLLPPEVCIMALGRVQTLPRFGRTGGVEAHKIMSITFSADHRIIDGATIANFSTAMKKYIESPATMVVHLA